MSRTFLGEDKEYEATMKLGERTDSGDCAGKVISNRTAAITKEDVTRAIALFEGEIEQTPPMVSAKHVNGKRLYALARKGIEIEREPNKVHVKEIRSTKMNLPFVDIKIVCSKGTYIRQLADDIGEKLGCGAHLTELRRTRSGAFSLKDAVRFSALDKMKKEDLDGNIIRV